MEQFFLNLKHYDGFSWLNWNVIQSACSDKTRWKNSSISRNFPLLSHVSHGRSAFVNCFCFHNWKLHNLLTKICPLLCWAREKGIVENTQQNNDQFGETISLLLRRSLFFLAGETLENLFALMVHQFLSSQIFSGSDKNDLPPQL